MERLIVNLGNSRVAWRGAGHAGVAAHRGAPERCLEQDFIGHAPPGEVVIGSVAREETTRALRQWCDKTWKAKTRVLAATAEACGVRSAYTEAARLGIDRWAALVAARHAHDGGVLIADCGTAVSVDYLAGDGRHMGGLIGPGLRLMREALTRGTRLELMPELAQAPALFAADTESAVAGGALGMIAAWLTRLAEQTAAHYGAPDALLITGGDAAEVCKRLSLAWQQVPNLVLDGLELLAESDS